MPLGLVHVSGCVANSHRIPFSSGATTTSVRIKLLWQQRNIAMQHNHALEKSARHNELLSRQHHMS